MGQPRRPQQRPATPVQVEWMCVLASASATLSWSSIGGANQLRMTDFI